MNRNTFTHPDVIQLLNAHFISIQVDSEARPDIGERYSDWAWPATAFMQPDSTQIMALRGSLRAAKFTPILQDLIARHAAGTLRADESTPYVAPDTPVSGPLDALIDQVYRQLERGYNDEIGGWGDAKVLEYAEPTLQFFLRGYLHNDDTATARGLLNAYGFADQTDLVWGGVYYASFKDWGNTVKEKRTESQAAGMQVFAAAYQLRGDPIFAARIADIHRYLQTHMRGADGLYFASQKDLVPGLTDINIEAYYARDDDARRALGLPSTDRATYTDLNARILFGYLQAFEATGENRYREAAEDLAAALLASRRTDAGWFLQLTPRADLRSDNRVHVLRFDERPYLRTQAYMGRALLALYAVTGEPHWLSAAERIADTLRTLLADPVHGGFSRPRRMAPKRSCVAASHSRITPSPRNFSICSVSPRNVTNGSRSRSRRYAPPLRHTWCGVKVASREI